jgi:hypothetical protein
MKGKKEAKKREKKEKPLTFVRLQHTLDDGVVEALRRRTVQCTQRPEQRLDLRQLLLGVDASESDRDEEEE